MTAVYVLAGFSVLLGGVAAYFGKNESHLPKLLVKTAASLLFCIAALAAFLRSSTDSPVYAASIALALILGLTGDIFLAAEALCSDKKTSSVFLIFGGACFLTGHLFYIVIFFILAPIIPLVFLLALVVPAMFLALALVPVIKTEDGKRVPILGAGKLLIPFLIYALILGLLLSSALNAYLHLNSVAGSVVLAASVLFILSDTSLAINGFSSVNFKLKPYLNYPVFILYYIAQALFAISIALI
ncbi:MAG: lysoplasmalogenase [Clostridiaceae bacterium]|jgi:uncharacterized membrane protein YhhN|nr:lysoplasmalogenase [Clostridiaceae bacterium]